MWQMNEGDVRKRESPARERASCEFVDIVSSTTKPARKGRCSRLLTTRRRPSLFPLVENPSLSHLLLAGGSERKPMRKIKDKSRKRPGKTEGDNEKKKKIAKSSTLSLLLAAAVSLSSLLFPTAVARERVLLLAAAPGEGAAASAGAAAAKVEALLLLLLHPPPT